MKLIVIAAIIAVGVCVLADTDDLRPPGFEVPHKWEKLQEDAVKMRDTITEADEKLKALVINDNPEAGQIIADKIDQIYLESMAIMDRMDAEIQAKTLTEDSFDEFFTEIHDAYHYKIITIVDDFKPISIHTQTLYLDAQVEVTVAMRTQAAAIKVLFIGD